MSDNPFAEPEDDNRTVIRPTPGRRRTPPAERPPVAGDESPQQETPASPPAATLPVAEGTEDVAVGGDVLLAAAAPLLQLMARLRNTANAPDSGDLYQRTVRQVRVFEQEARDKGVPLEQLRPAHYALCASLDDIVLNTPWGSSGSWSQRSLVSTFHQEVRSGERFFNVLKQMCDNPGRFLPVIKLMYLCMSLGFVGQYRLTRRGGEIARIREETYAVIARQQKAADADLAPHTKGVNAPYRPVRFVVPLWVAAAAGLGIIGGLFLWFSINLNSQSDTVYARLQGAPPDRMPTITRVAVVEPAPIVVTPPPPPPEPSALDKLRQFLKPEIDQKLVEVLGTPAQPLVRITGRGMFASGSATLIQSFKPLLDRIALALKEERGPVKVIGYTDNEPIRTIAFPSNFQLSAARAQAAANALAASIGDPSRISIEGRADADPIASNATPEGRERNRRIEIVLNRQGD